MPLCDAEIIEWAKDGGVSPYIDAHVNPASIDLTLGHSWRDFDSVETILETNHITLYPRSLRVEIHNWLCKWLPWRRMPTAVLAITSEWIRMPYNVAGEIKLKTTPTRKGLGHPIADWVDPGYEGRLTLMLHAVKKIDLWTHDRICQLVLWPMNRSSILPYDHTGHYMYQTVPTPAVEVRRVTER